MLRPTCLESLRVHVAVKRERNLVVGEEGGNRLVVVCFRSAAKFKEKYYLKIRPIFVRGCKEAV